MIKFTLIENSLDSIEQGLSFLKRADKKKDDSSFKHALLCLFHGTELILKEALVIIDPITIFDKNSLFKYCKSPLNPTIDELYNCRSIDIAGICRELKKHYPEVFTRSNIKTLKGLAKERNKLQHFAIEISPTDLMNQLLKLYLMLIKPAFKIIQEAKYPCLHDDGISEHEINERISDFEKSFLNIKIGEEFSRGVCPKCDSYLSFFIIYEGESYPIYCYCTACDYELKDLAPEDYHVCPECGAGSLVYDEEKKAGVCLWHKCYYCNEGGFVDMWPCETCSGYVIEDRCPNCSPDD